MSDELVKRLRKWTTDWNGAKMVPGEAPRDGLHCDIIDESADTIEALTAERDALRDREIRGLQQVAAMGRAMNDLLASPKGVVPESAAPFYDAKQGMFFGLEVRMEARAKAKAEEIDENYNSTLESIRSGARPSKYRFKL